MNHLFNGVPTERTLERRTRRQFTSAQKLRLLAEYDDLPRGRAITAMTRLAPARAERWYWATRPLFEAALHRERTPSVWRLA